MARTKIYRQKGKKADEKEKKIQAAVRGLDSGLYRTSRAAAKDLGIPKQFTTIWRRSRKRTRERREAHRNQMLLTSAQDRVLKGWMVWLATTGNPMSRETMVPKVFELSGREPSKKWCERWLARNLDLKMGKPTGLDPKRAKAFNFTTVNAHFHLFSQVVDMAEIPIENTLNLDEIGMALGGGRNGNAQEFFFSEDDRTRYRLQSDDLELVTVLETVCADGTAPVKPCFVFQGKLFCSEWADNDEDILLATTDSGWTNDNICMEWFKRNFIPQARAHGDPSKPFLLLLDGHGSHVTTDMIEIALENKIIIFQLPPHTTHRLQPCDVGAFGPLKTWWYKGCQSYLAQNGTSLPARDVVSVYMAAREKAFKTETVKAAWRKAGIDVDDISGLPKSNPGVFKPSDFKTSVSSSTTLDLPAGYVPDTGFMTDDDSDVSQDSSSDDESGDEDLDMDVVPTCQLFPIPNPYEADTDDDEDYMPPIRESLTVMVDEEEPIPDTDIDELSLASADLATKTGWISIDENMKG